MPSASVDWDRLGAFLEVARAGSFSRAARTLGRTQPALSHAVKELEREIGEALLLRERPLVKPTEAGRILIEHATTALSELGRGIERISALKGLRTGRLLLGTTDTHACHVLPPVLRAYRARFPGVELVLENRPSPAVAELVLKREVDLGFVTLPLPAALARRKELRAETAFATENVAICAPHHALSRRRRVRWTELAREPLLLLHTATTTRQAIDRAMRRLGRTPEIVLESGSLEVLKKLVALHFGVSIVPEFAVAREVARRELVALRIGQRGERAALGFVSRTTGTTPAAEAFIEVARSALGSGPRGAARRESERP